MSVEARYILVDVFTGQPFGGNQLAVFPDAEGLSPATMQALAREFNFAETTFVSPVSRSDCDHRVRIFTPRRELAFAGHPTLGTAAALAHLAGRAGAGAAGQYVLEEGVGPVPVAFEPGRRPFFGRLTRPGDGDTPPGAPTPTATARVLGLDPALVLDTRFAGVGLPFCLVRVASPAAVDRIDLDRGAWAATFVGTWAEQLFCWAGNDAPGGRLHARMFAPALGIEEDPATGSAAAALGLLFGDRLPDGTHEWVIDQGVAMGRPSRIEVRIVRQAGRTETIGVGGEAVVVGQGVMFVPPDR